MNLRARVEKLEKKINRKKEPHIIIFPKEFEPEKSADGYVASYTNEEGEEIWLTQKELDEFEGMIIQVIFAEPK